MDVDLLALGLIPGRSYQGRFVSFASPAIASDEFLFTLCTDSIAIHVQDPELIPGTTQSRYVVDLEADVAQPLSMADLQVTGSGALHGFQLHATFERTGPTSYRKVVIAPTAGCTSHGPATLEFEAIVRGANGVPFSHDGACLDLRASVGRCDNQLTITHETPECSAASPDQVVLRIQAHSADPTASIVLERSSPGPTVAVGEPFAMSSGPTCGTTSGPGGVVALHCVDRLVVADVAGVPAGPARFAGRLEPAAGSALATAERDVTIDRAAPAVSMLEPAEGASACVERDGQVERVALVLRVDDAVPSVALTDAAYRLAGGPWQPMCLGSDCGPTWGDLPTGQVLERQWDVRGLADGEYELRLDVCDRSGNRTSFTRHVSITRGATAVGVVSTTNPDFSPNDDGRADFTSVTFHVPQALDVTVEARAGSATGAVVRRLAGQQLPAGNHEFTWDGRNDSGGAVPDGTYFLVAAATNACGGTAETSSRAQLDTLPPVAEIASPASGALVNTSTDVLGRATDAGFKSYTLSFGAGPSPTSWSRRYRGSLWECVGVLGSSSRRPPKASIRFGSSRSTARRTSPRRACRSTSARVRSSRASRRARRTSHRTATAGATRRRSSISSCSRERSRSRCAMPAAVCSGGSKRR